jgi:acetyltransferase-like isoleucine patch superfamily enzyme
VNRVYLLGATQEARTIANLLLSKFPLMDLEVFVRKGHGEVGSTFHGMHVKGMWEAFQEMRLVEAYVVFADPDPKARAEARQIVPQYWPVGAVTAPTAVVASSAKIGKGSIVFPGALIQDGVEIGDYVMVGPGVIVGAESVVGDFSTLKAGTILGEKVYVGRGGLCGLGAVVSAKRRMGPWSAVLDAFHLRKDLAPGASS